MNDRADTGAKPIISARDLAVHLPIGGGVFGAKSIVQAVEGVSLDIPRGSFFGLVGPRGSMAWAQRSGLHGLPNTHSKFSI